jgi:hypothetical protein
VSPKNSVQKGKDLQRAVGGDQAKSAHAASEQRMSRAEVVMNAQSGHLRCELSATLVHAEEHGNGVPQALVRSSGRRPGSARNS